MAIAQWRHNPQDSDTQHNDTHHEGLKCDSISSDTQRNNALQ